MPLGTSILVCSRLAILVCSAATAVAFAAPIPVKVVVVTMFESGANSIYNGGFVQLTGLDRVRLILLKSDQRRHDNRGAGQQTTRDLVNGRLA